MLSHFCFSTLSLKCFFFAWFSFVLPCALLFCAIPCWKEPSFVLCPSFFPLWLIWFAVKDWPSLKKQQELVSQFACIDSFPFFTWVFLLCLALVWFCVPGPGHSWQHDICLQPNASLACRQMNITVSHSALIVSVFVKTRKSIKVSNVLKLTNDFFLCFHEFVFARHALILFCSLFIVRFYSFSYGINWCRLLAIRVNADTIGAVFCHDHNKHKECKLTRRR